MHDGMGAESPFDFVGEWPATGFEFRDTESQHFIRLFDGEDEVCRALVSDPFWPIDDESIFYRDGLIGVRMYKIDRISTSVHHRQKGYARAMLDYIVSTWGHTGVYAFVWDEEAYPFWRLSGWREFLRPEAYRDEFFRCFVFAPAYNEA